MEIRKLREGKKEKTAFAYEVITVPKATVIFRKASNGAYGVMRFKHLHGSIHDS